jgi:hypothetical protein
MGIDDEDILQDLSLEDADELRAFAEKRVWFEGKLRVCFWCNPAQGWTD